MSRRTNNARGKSWVRPRVTSSNAQADVSESLLRDRAVTRQPSRLRRAETATAPHIATIDRISFGNLQHLGSLVRPALAWPLLR
jgi:hypothetical protein